MFDLKKIAVIIPAYNEEKTIASVVNSVCVIKNDFNFLLNIIVVNDCSTDSTAEIISNLNCIALNLPVNLGIGGAVQTGFKYAFENNFDFVIQMDGDGQHPANEIHKLVNASLLNQHDIIIGSRFISNQGFQTSLIRRIGINYFKNLIYFLVGKKINDCTSGFRIHNRKALEIVIDYYPDEYPEPESIILFSLKNLSISEIPVTMLERQGGKSSIGYTSSIYYFFKVTLAILYTYIRIKNKKKK